MARESRRRPYLVNNQCKAVQRDRDRAVEMATAASAATAREEIFSHAIQDRETEMASAGKTGKDRNTISTIWGSKATKQQ
jgi:hypothetical protein